MRRAPVQCVAQWRPPSPSPPGLRNPCHGLPAPNLVLLLHNSRDFVTLSFLPYPRDTVSIIDTRLSHMRCDPDPVPTPHMRRCIRHDMVMMMTDSIIIVTGNGEFVVAVVAVWLPLASGVLSVPSVWLPAFRLPAFVHVQLHQPYYTLQLTTTTTTTTTTIDGGCCYCSCCLLLLPGLRLSTRHRMIKVSQRAPQRCLHTATRIAIPKACILFERAGEKTATSMAAASTTRNNEPRCTHNRWLASARKSPAGYVAELVAVASGCHCCVCE